MSSGLSQSRYLWNSGSSPWRACRLYSVDRRHQRTRGQTEPRLHLLDGVEAVDQRLLEELVRRIPEDLRVEDQVADAVRLLDQKSGGASVIGILGDEAAPVRIDEDALSACRRADRRARSGTRGRDRRGSPPAETPSRIPEPSSFLVPCLIRSRGIQASSRVEHLVVHDVAACRQHHAAARTHVAVLAEVAVAHADDAAGVVRDQRDRAHVAADAHAELRLPAPISTFISSDPASIPAIATL